VGKHEKYCYGPGYGLVKGIYKFGNEKSGSIKEEEFLDYLLKKDSASQNKFSLQGV